MILDKQNMFSSAQALTVTAVSSNVIDLGADNALTPVPNEKPAKVHVGVNTAFAGGTSLQAVLQTSVDEAFTSPIDVVMSGVVLTASLTAGYKFPITELPPGLKRYIRMKYVIDGTMTAGKIDAGLVIGRQTNE